MASVTLPAHKHIKVTFVTAADAQDAGDVITNPVLLEDAVRDPARPAILHTLKLVDAGDNTAAAMTLVILRSNTAVGTIDAAPNISDANIKSEVVGCVPIADTDWVDLGGAKVATLRDIGLMCSTYVDGDGDGTDLYAVLIAAGTPTPGSTSAYSAEFGFVRS